MFCVSVNLVIPEPGRSLVEAYDKWLEMADAKACCDFAFRICVTSWSDKVADEMEVLTKEKGKIMSHVVFLLNYVGLVLFYFLFYCFTRVHLEKGPLNLFIFVLFCLLLFLLFSLLVCKLCIF